MNDQWSDKMDTPSAGDCYLLRVGRDTAVGGLVISAFCRGHPPLETRFSHGTRDCLQTNPGISESGIEDDGCEDTLDAVTFPADPSLAIPHGIFTIRA